MVHFLQEWPSIENFLFLSYIFKQYSFMTFTIIIRLAPSPKLKLDCAYLGQKEPNLTNKDLRELTEPNLCEVKKCTSMACFFKKE